MQVWCVGAEGKRTVQIRHVRQLRLGMQAMHRTHGF